jgi:phosphate transport system permease protein
VSLGSAVATRTVVSRSLRSSGPDWRGLAFQALLLLSLLFALATLAVLVIDIVSRGLPVLTERGGDFLSSNLSSRAGSAGIWQGIYGSLLIAIFVAIFAIPIGVMTAIYLEEYATDSRLTRFITVNIRNLAGVPSVVYGLLGLAVFVPLTQAIGGGTGRSIVSASITLACLVLPIVIITSSEALRAVPGALREAGYGVGASRWQVTRSLVLPAAIPGILTGTILSISRALGESAPLIVIGASYTFFSTGQQDAIAQLFGSFTALPVVVFGWSSRPETDFRALTAATIIALLAVTLAANTIAIYLRNRFELRW